MATERDDIEGRNGEEGDEVERTASNWLGRWVMMLAIVAFLIVYVAQLYRGTGLTFSILTSTAAMGIVGLGGLVIRKMLLRTASQDRAASILTQMQRLRDEAEEDETGAGA